MNRGPYWWNQAQDSAGSKPRQQPSKPDGRRGKRGLIVGGRPKLSPRIRVPIALAKMKLQGSVAKLNLKDKKGPSSPAGKFATCMKLLPGLTVEEKQKLMAELSKSLKKEPSSLPLTRHTPWPPDPPEKAPGSLQLKSRGNERAKKTQDTAQSLFMCPFHTDYADLGIQLVGRLRQAGYECRTHDDKDDDEKTVWKMTNSIALVVIMTPKLHSKFEQICTYGRVSLKMTALLFTFQGYLETQQLILQRQSGFLVHDNKYLVLTPDFRNWPRVEENVRKILDNPDSTRGVDLAALVGLVTDEKQEGGGDDDNKSMKGTFCSVLLEDDDFQDSIPPSQVMSMVATFGCKYVAVPVGSEGEQGGESVDFALIFVTSAMSKDTNCVEDLKACLHGGLVKRCIFVLCGNMDESWVRTVVGFEMAGKLYIDFRSRFSLCS